MRKRMKSLLAVVLAFVLVFSMAMPGFAADGEDMSSEGVATEQTATPSDLPTTGTQTATPAALVATAEIQPFNSPPNIAPGRTININTLDMTGADGWSYSNGLVTITQAGAFLIDGGATPSATPIDIRFHINANADIILRNVNINPTINAQPLVWTSGFGGDDVFLWLEGDNELAVGTVVQEAVQIGNTPGRRFTIDGTGSLTTNGTIINLNGTTVINGGNISANDIHSQAIEYNGGDLTLGGIPQWRVSFDLGSATHTGGQALLQTIANNGNATLPTGLVRSGYNHTGWSGVYNNVTSHRTITAQWTAEYTPTPPTITTTTLPNGTVGTAYNQTLTATGTTPITWTVDSGTLPNSLSLNANTGVISGTPTASGTFNFTIMANNGVNPNATQAFAITVNAQQPSTGNGGWSEPSTNYGSLSPSSANFDLASPRNLTITLDRGDFTFQNAIRFGSGNNAINLVRDRDFTAAANNNNTTTITIMAEWLSEHMTVGTRHLTFVMSGGNTLSFRLNVTDTRPATTDPTSAMPMVQVDLSPALTAELMERLGDRFDDLDISIMAEFGTGFDMDLIVRFSVGDETIFDLEAHYYLMVDMSDFEMEDMNYHRLAALYSTSGAFYQGHIRGILGGSFNPETQIFTLPSNHTGPIFISYFENLIRLDMNLNSPTITDLAGNAPTQTMDVLPFIQDGRTLIPIRFIGDALGAEIDWTNATDDRPLIVHITLDGQTLNIPIGETTPQLAELGLDVHAQIISGRTVVPLRFVSEFFGAVVYWDDETRSIEIISIRREEEADEGI